MNPTATPSSISADALKGAPVLNSSQLNSIASEVGNKNTFAPTPADASNPPVKTAPSTNTPPATDTQNNTTPTPPDPNQQTITDTSRTLSTVNDQLDSAANDFHKTMTAYANGSIPLTQGEQAQVDTLKQSYQQLIDQQKQQNTSANGVANIRGYQTGAAEYDPTFQAKTIGTIVSTGLAKVSDLTTKMAGAIASLTTSLQNNDIANIKSAYDEYNKYLTDKQATLQNTINSAQKAIQDAQAEQDKQQQYQLDVAKFNETKDQNAFDQAFKVEQEKFAENKDAATLAETSRHNRASEAISAYKAGQGVGGGGASLGGIPSASLQGNGAPDPVSQKAVLDGITQQYGPMTAQAIKGLADYSLNPADWSSRAGTNGMSRAQAVSLAQMVDPTYSDAMYNTRASYLKNLTSGTMASGVLSANKSINHLIAFTNSVSQLDNKSSFSGLNAFNNAIESHNPFDPNYQTTIKTAQTEANGLKDELAKFFKGTGTSDVSSIDSWSKSLDVNASPANQKGLVQGAINLLAGQLDVMNQQYTSTMGKAPENTILQPATVAKLSDLKNKGYTVDIPGVLYTDPKAYIANDPSGADNLKAVISKYPNLSQADALQLAQSL